MSGWKEFLDRLYAKESKSDDEDGIAHHGPRILTHRDLAVAHSVVRWIETVRKRDGWYGEKWLPSGADFEKSRLFWRIRSGKDPLPHPPPTAYSCPWYELIDEPDRPHWAYDMTMFEGRAHFAQCGYEVLEHDEAGKPKRAKFGPWTFRCWFGPSPHNADVEGWWLQLEQPEAAETVVDADA